MVINHVSKSWDDPPSRSRGPSFLGTPWAKVAIPNVLMPSIPMRPKGWYGLMGGRGARTLGEAARTLTGIYIYKENKYIHLYNIYNIYIYLICFMGLEYLPPYPTLIAFF